MTFKINANKIIWFWNISNEFVAKNLHENIVKYVSEPRLTYMFYMTLMMSQLMKTKDNEIEEEEINAALLKESVDPSWQS